MEFWREIWIWMQIQQISPKISGRRGGDFCRTVGIIDELRSGRLAILSYWWKLQPILQTMWSAWSQVANLS